MWGEGPSKNGHSDSSMDGGAKERGLSLKLTETTDFVEIGEFVSIHSKDGNMDVQTGSSELLVVVSAMEFRDRFGLNDDLNDDGIVVAISAVVSFSTSTVPNRGLRSSGGLM